MRGIYRIGLIGMAIATAFLVGEFALRSFLPQTTFDSLETAFTFPCFQNGTYYWLKLKSNATCILHSTVEAFPDVAVYTNAMGFRGPNIAPRQHGVTRILFIGDSFTFGWGVSEERTYPEQVKKILSDRYVDKHFEIINAGLPSTGMGRAYLMLKNELAALDPDIVVIGFYPFSDVGYDTIVNRWLDIDEKGLPQKIVSTAAYVGTNGNLRASSLPLKFKIPALRHSHVFALLMDQFFPDEIESDNSIIAKYGTCLYKRTCRDLDPYRERVQKLLLASHNLLVEKQVDHLVAMIPSEFSVYPDIRFKYGITVPMLPWDKEYPTIVFDEFFTKNNIPHVPLRLVFLAHLNEKTYFTKDDHWNNRGHEIAAEAIADRLAEIIESKPFSDTKIPDPEN